MSTARISGRRPVARAIRLLGYEGPVAAVLLGTFQYFVASMCFVAGLLPLLAFQALVGWQATHLAIWLGALSLLTVFPALHALLLTAEVLREDAASARAGRVFWRGFAVAVVRMPWASAGFVALALLLGYDIALLGADDTMLLIGAVALATILALAVAVSTVAAQREQLSALATVAAAATAIARRPHVALVWLLLAALAVGATLLPVVGAVAWCFGPAAAAVAARICTRTLGFDAVAKGR